jgi:hypothetical protein
MDWIIKSKDAGRTGENHYSTEVRFHAALTDIFDDPQKQFVSATLPDGKMLDEASGKEFLLSGRVLSEWTQSGETPDACALRQDANLTPMGPQALTRLGHHRFARAHRANAKTARAWRKLAGQSR